MHLLSAAQIGSGDREDPVDLGQTPGEIVVLSAADSELALLARAAEAWGDRLPGLRLANLLRLAHPYSVDLHVEGVLCHARLVIVRVLGGASYWPYGLERLEELARDSGLLLACLPGDDKPDDELFARGNLGAEPTTRLWRYFVEGGPANARHLLAFAAGLIGTTLPWARPEPLPAAGFYRHGAVVELASDGSGDRPLALVTFYRALLQADDLAPIDAMLEALESAGMHAVGLWATSLRAPEAASLVARLAIGARPAIVLNATGFAVSRAGQDDPLARFGCPVLQVVLASEDEAVWRASTRGLAPRDLAMSVVLPEVDGRILARAISFKAAAAFDPRCEIHVVRHRPVRDRVAFAAELARRWVALRRKPTLERRVAIVLPNYPSRDGRLANGVGLDTPASAVELLRAMHAAGYAVDGAPDDPACLMGAILEGPTNATAGRGERLARVLLSIGAYRLSYARLPAELRTAVEARWGPAEADPHLVDGAFPLAILPFGEVVIGLQPARGYQIDPVATYHDPALVPPHHYLAFHFWLREVWRADAVVHLGKHGNLEWLPGKALALSASCWPEAILGPLPQLYPFIVNDPGEGSQAKRRTSAVIVDHLTPPLARAESYGALRELENLVDEYWQASGLDPRRLGFLEAEILDRTSLLGLDQDLGFAELGSAQERLGTLDGHLCELKELQIRDGLHILGRSPVGPQRDELLVALVRLPRGADDGASGSLPRALARDLGLAGFDPLAAELGAAWDAARPQVLARLSENAWRTAGDTVERLERLCLELVAGRRAPEPEWTATRTVLEEIATRLAPSVDQCGSAEIEALLVGLAGQAVAPGPSGAPTRGRPEVLPTGRNFFSIDTRAVPTPAAWSLGWRSASLVLERYLQLHGEWPKRLALSAWGTACMRTGGDDIAQALAFLGCRPVWEPTSGRVTGIEIMPAEVLGRPRIDLTLRVSGLFRDAFPAQLDLLDDAIRGVAGLDEPADINPLAAMVGQERRALLADGWTNEDAARLAGARLFSAPPGAYGAGLQVPIDEGCWGDVGDLAEAFVAWGGYAYGRRLHGAPAASHLRARLTDLDLVVHNQDNREHDILDSDDYYQFEGGLIAAARAFGSSTPTVFHNDHSRPEHPRVRRLEEEIGLVVRGRAANPKWIAGVMRHGYKGAFEMVATVDYLFAFAATTGLVGDHHFDALYDAYLGDDEVAGFIARSNPSGLREMAERFAEARRRGLWRARRNRVDEELAGLLSAGRSRPAD